MITLITGTPGAGKTAWTVQEMTRLPTQRKLYVHGIPDLKIAHEPIYCQSDFCDLCRSNSLLDNPAEDSAFMFVEDWPYWATPGSLIIIDEVQRIWRPTNSSSGVQEGISRLETHRHLGLDFWLISQGPHLFHSNIRLLVGRHIHLVAKWNGRSEYEWPECRQNVTSRSDAVVRPYSLPKKIFHLYTSASLHTVQKHRKPLAFYGLIVSLVLMVIVFSYVFMRLDSKLHPEPKLETSTQTDPALAGVVGGLVSSSSQGGYPDFKPAIDGVPESAPAYSGLIKVTQAPILAGCIQSQKGCKCFTNQATPYPATVLYCQEVVVGHRFNPYLRGVEYSNQDFKKGDIPISSKIELKVP